MYKVNCAAESSWPHAVPESNFFRCTPFRCLIEGGASIEMKDARGFTPALLAASCDNLDILQFLASAGGDLNAVSDNGSTALILAARNGHLGVIRYLLEAGEAAGATGAATCDKTDHSNRTALAYAASHGHVEVSVN